MQLTMDWLSFKVLYDLKLTSPKVVIRSNHSFTCIQFTLLQRISRIQASWWQSRKFSTLIPCQWCGFVWILSTALIKCHSTSFWTFFQSTLVRCANKLGCRFGPEFFWNFHSALKYGQSGWKHDSGLPFLPKSWHPVKPKDSNQRK